MDNLRAAILRPQLKVLGERVARWEDLYRSLEAGLVATAGLALVDRPEAETFVGSSFQFLLPDWPAQRVQSLVARSAARGVELKWFGANMPVAFTSNHHSWRYVAQQHLPATDHILSTLLDMRLPLTFTLDDCELIGRIISAFRLFVCTALVDSCFRDDDLVSSYGDLVDLKVGRTRFDNAAYTRQRLRHVLADAHRALRVRGQLGQLRCRTAWLAHTTSTRGDRFPKRDLFFTKMERDVSRPDQQRCLLGAF
jgi:hypothetical protein